MKLNDDLLKILARTYAKSTLINTAYKKKDISFKTDEEGNPVLLFIGKRTEDGHIRGQRYARTLKRESEGNIVKDHWEMKGKAT